MYILQSYFSFHSVAVENINNIIIMRCFIDNISAFSEIVETSILLSFKLKFFCDKIFEERREARGKSFSNVRLGPPYIYAGLGPPYILARLGLPYIYARLGLPYIHARLGPPIYMLAWDPLYTCSLGTT